MKPLLSSKEAAELLATAHRKSWELANRGRVPSTPIGTRRVRFRPKNLERKVRRHKKENHAASREVLWCEKPLGGGR